VRPLAMGHETNSTARVVFHLFFFSPWTHAGPCGANIRQPRKELVGEFLIEASFVFLPAALSPPSPEWINVHAMSLNEVPGLFHRLLVRAADVAGRSRSTR